MERLSVTVYRCSECAAPIRHDQERCDYCGFWFKPRPVPDPVLVQVNDVSHVVEYNPSYSSHSSEWWTIPLALGVAFVALGVFTGWPAWIFIFFSTLLFFIYGYQLLRGAGSGI
jgi:DNA-directed RNA polymerase subunit RPC12/RpoP